MTRVARMAGGVMVWALHFGAIYGFTALACARGFPGAVPWFAGAASLLAATALGLLIARNVPRRAGFESWMTASIAALALVGVVFETVPVYMVRTCG